MNEACNVVNVGKVAVTFDEVEAYYRQNSKIWKALLDMVETSVIEARDKDFVPVYSTKCRIKSTESIYLKTKRTGKTLGQIEDYSGLRILCLFEEDLIKVNAALLEIFSKLDLLFDRYKVYNFDDPIFLASLREGFTDKFQEHRGFVPSRKLSGYKSIHYIVGQKQNTRKVFVEVQLRTLMQDVWGELEHALSYKRGMIHPHIKKSFMLLARDIETNDILMSHLRDINRKEATKDRYGVRKNGLRHYFKYDEGIYPTQLEDQTVQGLCREYEKVMEDIVKNKALAGNGAIKKANEKYKILRKEVVKIFPDQIDEDMNLKYWLEMENALLMSMNNEYERALKEYNKLLVDYPERYVLLFRIGEMHFILGQTSEALRAFDRSETVLQAAIVVDSKSNIKCRNLVTIKRKLAYTFWMLGDQYLAQSLCLTRDIEKILSSREDAFNGLDEYYAMCNNMCWYTTQRWQINLKELDCCDVKVMDDYKREIDESKAVATAWYEKLVLAVAENKKEKKEIPSNWLDTMAFYCYCVYIDTHDPSFKELAQQYATECDHGTNYATLSLTSLSMHINHMTEIMSLG